MNAYLFVYQLVPQSGRDVRHLEDELMKCPSYGRYLPNAWILGTDETAGELNNRIAFRMRETDSWLITALTRDYSGFLPKDAWELIAALVGPRHWTDALPR